MKKDEKLATKINERAYQLYVSKGSNDGSDLDDWLQAEKEVLHEVVKESKTKKRANTSSTRKKRERVKVRG